MKKIDLLKDLGLDSSYIIHEYVETDKVIYVIANKENTVMFVMKKVAGVGSGSGQSQTQNQEIDYVIYVADSANN